MLIIRIDDNTIDFLNIVELLKVEIETINNFYYKCMSKIKCCGQNISSNFFKKMNDSERYYEVTL